MPFVGLDAKLMEQRPGYRAVSVQTILMLCMRRTLKFTSIAGFCVAATLLLALAFQYQLRLRLVVDEPVMVSFSKGAWIECLVEPELVGHIQAVNLRGIVVTDTSGSFTRSNLRVQRKNGEQVCSFPGISVVDAESKRYFIAFRFLGGLRKAHRSEWFWNNAFAT